MDWGETHQRKVHRVGYNGKVELSVHIIILSVVYLIRLCSWVFLFAMFRLIYCAQFPLLHIYVTSTIYRSLVSSGWLFVCCGSLNCWLYMYVLNAASPCFWYTYVGAPHIPPSPGEFASGDLVRVVLDLETFKHKQLKACIEWQDKMAEVQNLGNWAMKLVCLDCCVTEIECPMKQLCHFAVRYTMFTADDWKSWYNSLCCGLWSTFCSVHTISKVLLLSWCSCQGVYV